MDKDKLAFSAYPDKDLSQIKNGTDNSPELRAAFIKGMEVYEKNSRQIISDYKEQNGFLLKCLYDLKKSLSMFPKFEYSKEYQLIDTAINFPKRPNNLESTQNENN